MDEKTKLLLDWLIKMGVICLDVNSETLWQEFLDNNKEQLNKLKNLGEGEDEAETGYALLSDRKRPEKLILSEKNEYRIGTDSELEKSCMGDYLELNIDREDHYNQAYVSFAIDKEMAIKIKKYFETYYGI